jgi:hypothetical protein
MMSGRNFAISQHNLLEACHSLPALFDQRAQGMPGARSARRRMCELRVGDVAHTRWSGHTGIVRHSPRDGYDSVLPSERTFSHRRRQSCLHRLDTHVGCQDHTRRPQQALSSSAPSASTAARPTLMTLANAPLLGWDAQTHKLICDF